jgi:hypothetical protein
MTPIGPFRGRGLLIAGVAFAFAAPYFMVSAVDAYRDAQWTASGLSPYEIGEWREHGFASVADAVSWRNARFKAPGAVLWKEEGWRDADQAAGWRDQDFGAREARRWRDLGFDAWQARPWRDAGFLAEDARPWRDAGVAPAVAAMKRKKGEEPE